MLTPQEIEVWYVLPKIRSAIALELKNKGIAQKKIAEIMDITPAAISQYLHNKRAKKIDFNIDKKVIDNGVKKIINNPKNYTEVLQEALKNSKHIICKIHKKIEKVNTCCGLCKK